MKGSGKRSWALAVLLACFTGFVAASTFEISPKSPTECDRLTLRVQRSFTEDCLWKATPTVRREGRQIDIELALRGSATCDQALVDRTFEVLVGPFPPGKYVLTVRWSDIDAVESKPLTVAPARSERAASEKGT